MRYIVVGCGLSGSVVARFLAERGDRVTVWDRRGHIGGNMFDRTDEHGFLVQMYGPHTFHTNDPSLFEYMDRFEDWEDYDLRCGAVWDGRYTPTPFNFTTIDTFFPAEKAADLKARISAKYPGRETMTVVEALNDDDEAIRGYAEYLFENDYRPYTSKQWGKNPADIDPSVLKRVPIRFSYRDAYFDDRVQVMPKHSFTRFFENLLDHPNIEVKLGVEALGRLSFRDGLIAADGDTDVHVVYTGALDELMGYRFGRLPYRSLTFDYRYSDEESHQPAPVVAYPQEDGFIRVTEYKKLPHQDRDGTVYAVESSHEYDPDKGMEPYYPVLTEESIAQYAKYKAEAEKVGNLSFCGRLADFKYYNMDQALSRALGLTEKL